MSDFTELFMSIHIQMEDHLKDWKEENEWKDGDDLEEFFLEYTNHERSLECYKINDEELNDSYREGSVWILNKLQDEYGFDAEYILKTLKNMSEDNREYAKQLIYFVGTEI